MVYFVTLKFPSSLSQYLPPNATILPSNIDFSDGIVSEYCVSWNNYLEAVETGQLTLLFDPDNPGIELPQSVHWCNWYFWGAFFYLSGASTNCSFIIGWLISLFHNEKWCGLAEYTLMALWVLPSAVLCSYYCWFNSHHQLAVLFESFLPTIKLSLI